MSKSVSATPRTAYARLAAMKVHAHLFQQTDAKAKAINAALAGLGQK
jgi:hypothetical protein